MNDRWEEARERGRAAAVVIDRAFDEEMKFPPEGLGQVWNVIRARGFPDIMGKQWLMGNERLLGEGVSPLEALHAGRLSDVLHAASTLGEQGS